MNKFQIPPDLLKKILGNEAPPFPSKATIHITNHCNLRCEFCWHHSPLKKTRPKPYYFPTSKVIGIIKELASMGTREIFLSAKGEPSSHPAFPDIVNAVKDSGMVLIVITNLSSFSSKVASAYARANILVVNLSATNKAHYNAIQAPSSSKTFDQVIRNIRAFTRLYAKLGHPRIMISSVITRNNFTQIQEMIATAKSLKVASIYFKIIEHTSATKRLLPNKRELNELRNNIIALIKKPLGIHTNLIDILRKIGSSDNDTPTLSRHCIIGWLTIDIKEDGSVGLCCRNNSLEIGNWHKNSIHEIWTDSNAQRLRILTKRRMDFQNPLWENCYSCSYAMPDISADGILKTYASNIL